MECPKCRERDMVPVFTEQGAEIDSCPHCKGIWLDGGELDLVNKELSAIMPVKERGFSEFMRMFIEVGE